LIRARRQFACNAKKQDAFEIREKMLDKTIADSFPAGDPPSTDPAPGADSFAERRAVKQLPVPSRSLLTRTAQP
jgi:hypothetical protein